jgi:hypothetical protein
MGVCMFLGDKILPYGVVAGVAVTILQYNILMRTTIVCILQSSYSLQNFANAFLLPKMEVSVYVGINSMTPTTFLILNTSIFMHQIKTICYARLSKVLQRVCDTAIQHVYIISPLRMKRADRSMTLPSLAMLRGSPEPGHLRSAHLSLICTLMTNQAHKLT